MCGLSVLQGTHTVFTACALSDTCSEPDRILQDTGVPGSWEQRASCGVVWGRQRAGGGDTALLAKAGPGGSESGVDVL